MSVFTLRAFVLSLAVFLPLALAGCTGSVSEPHANGPGGAGPEGPGTPERPGPDPTRPEPTSCDTFQASTVHTYGAKVKNLVVSLPLTNEELTSLQANPEALSAMVDGWMATPEAERKLVDFFRTAFQQEGFEPAALAEQWGDGSILGGFLGDEGTRIEASMRGNFETSFARTAVEIVKSGEPFNETVTTQRFMMTTALLSMMAYQDERHRTDGGQRSYRTLDDAITRVTWARTGPIPASQTLDPRHANFMRFHMDSDRAVPPCAGDEISSDRNHPSHAFHAMFGFFSRLGPADGCHGDNQLGPARLNRSDFEDWRMVTVRKPGAGEATTMFFDLPGLRTATELVVHTPRVGFFTTPAFFAVWETNEDNEARVTANQTLITAFSQSIDDSQVIIPALDDALDGAHADPTTACWGCHKTLDPMRQIFRQEYTYFSNEQQNEEVRAIPASFAWDGVSAEPTTIFEFADTIATHPQFARGWVQKMCFYANSAACPEGPEFDRTVQAFIDSGYDFRVMFRTLLTSAHVTSAACIEGGSGDNAGISRTRHFCAALSNRLGIEDTCGAGLIYEAEAIPLRNRNSSLVSAIPDDAFSRGDQNPLTVSDLNLFVRGTYERICINTAQQMVMESEAMFTPGASEAAIDFFTTELMGFPASDPRHIRAREILVDHYEEGRAAEGSSDVAALQSAFVLACLSPSLIGMGL